MTSRVARTFASNFPLKITWRILISPHRCIISEKIRPKWSAGIFVQVPLRMIVTVHTLQETFPNCWVALRLW